MGLAEPVLGLESLGGRVDLFHSTENLHDMCWVAWEVVSTLSVKVCGNDC